MIRIHQKAIRGQTRTVWLDSYHTFSFGSFQDPKRMGLGNLRVLMGLPMPKANALAQATGCKSPQVKRQRLIGKPVGLLRLIQAAKWGPYAMKWYSRVPLVVAADLLTRRPIGYTTPQH